MKISKTQNLWFKKNCIKKISIKFTVCKKLRNKFLITKMLKAKKFHVKK